MHFAAPPRVSLNANVAVKNTAGVGAGGVVASGLLRALAIGLVILAACAAPSELNGEAAKGSPAAQKPWYRIHGGKLKLTVLKKILKDSENPSGLFPPQTKAQSVYRVQSSSTANWISMELWLQLDSGCEGFEMEGIEKELFSLGFSVEPLSSTTEQLFAESRGVVEEFQELIFRLESGKNAQQDAWKKNLSWRDDALLGKIVATRECLNPMNANVQAFLSSWRSLYSAAQAAMVSYEKPGKDVYLPAMVFERLRARWAEASSGISGADTCANHLAATAQGINALHCDYLYEAYKALPDGGLSVIVPLESLMRRYNVAECYTGQLPAAASL